MKLFFLFAQVVHKKTKQPIAGRAPFQIGNPDFKMTHAEVIAFKNAHTPHPHLIHIIQEA